jgi:hypothetical protein
MENVNWLPTPDIASLPAGLFSTPAKLSWRHACIAPLPADLFSIPAGLQTLPTAHINIFILFFFYRQLSGVTLKILWYFIVFLDLIRIFYTVLYPALDMFYF